MNRFVIPAKKGASLFCTINEEWNQVLSRQLRCGQKFRRKVKRTVGVSEEHREDLETTIKGSFGIKGIAQLESSIRAASGTNVRFEEIKEEEETIEVEAPPRGKYILRQSQKKQVLLFEGVDSGWFSSEPWFLIVERHLEDFRDDSRRYDFDPNCGGGGAGFLPPEPPDGVLELSIEGGKLTVSCQYNVTQKGVELRDLGLRAESTIPELLASRGSIPTDHLSVPSLFLANIKKKEVDVIFGEPRIAATPSLSQFSVGTWFPAREPSHSYAVGAMGVQIVDEPYSSHGVTVQPMLDPHLLPRWHTAWQDVQDLPMVHLLKSDG